MAAMFQAGSFKLNSGHASEVGTSTTTFTAITFPTPFPVGSNVVVIPMVQTFNGCQTPGLRIAEVSKSGFKVRMNEVIVDGKGALSDGKHNEETIGYVAFAV